MYDLCITILAHIAIYIHQAKKIYLVLMTGGGTLPRGLQDENESGSLQAQYQRR